MILYFSGTGNCLSIARQIAENTSEQVMTFYEATKLDLSRHSVVGLVYPSYYFNAPTPVVELTKQLTISPDAYVFIVVPCGAQTGNSVWSVEQILKHKGIKVAYCNKIRVPDCSAIGFGRNPNDQKWKFNKYAQRLQTIIKDIKERRHSKHFGAWGIAGWFCSLTWMKRYTKPLLQPQVNTRKCIGCNTCVSICPQNNISIADLPQNKFAFIGDNCAQCLRCVHFCPKQAIEIAGKPTPKEHQYHNPDVKLKNLLEEKL
ncbi:MAG: EFR1 family ferrodoxin [Paludibacteraceae bacterium]|nr:EFR1 family ferrodoxin [Paludibacteraceae bacterium]